MNRRLSGIIIILAVLIVMTLIESNQSLVCDKDLDICSSKILGMNIGSVKLSNITSADIYKEVRNRSNQRTRYCPRLIINNSYFNFYFVSPQNEIKAQGDVEKFINFRNSKETHFEVRSGFSSLFFGLF